MIHRIQVVACVGVMCCAVALIGCSDTENQQARERAEAAEAKLQEVEAQQRATQSERDELKADVGGLSQTVQDLKSQLSTAAKLKEQVSKLMVERDSAIVKLTDQANSLIVEHDSAITKLTTAQATIVGMKSQLQEQIQKFSQLDEQNKELQIMIDELTKKLGGEFKLPAIPKFW